MNDNIIGRPSSEGGAEQAAAWLARLLSPECTREERAAFELWLARSPRHVDAYLDAEATHRLAGALGEDPFLRAAARRARRESAGRGARIRGWLGAGLAAALALVAGGALWLSRPAEPEPATFATAVGEQRSLALADGTQVRLDTDSAIVARLGADAREIEVTRGRVQFAVARDPRPFSVRAGAGVVRDIGTTFQVSRSGGQVSVGLIEGAVIVSGRTGLPPARLAPGQQIAIDEGGRLGAPQAFDLAVAEGWTRGELVFKQRRLDALVAEMNRYSKTQLRLADPELGALTVSGVFHIGDQASLVAALQQGWSLRAERTDDGEIVLRRAR